MPNVRVLIFDQDNFLQRISSPEDTFLIEAIDASGSDSNVLRIGPLTASMLVLGRDGTATFVSGVLSSSLFSGTFRGDGRQLSGVTDFPFDRIVTVDAVDKRADYNSIQAAINAATSGTTIVIGPGEYAEDLTIKGGIHLVGYGTDTTPGVRTSVNGTYFGNGTLLSGSGSGLAIVENIDFYASFEGGTGNTVSTVFTKQLNLYMRNCEITNFYNGFGGGTLYGARISGSGLLYLDNCTLEVSDPAIQSSTAHTISHFGNYLELRNSWVKADLFGLVMSGTVGNLPSADLLFSRIEGITSVVTASQVNIVSCRVNSTGGMITDHDTETILVHREYGLLYTNGRNDLYKLNLRQLPGDPASPEDGDVWYNNSTDKLRAREAGVSVNVIQGAAPGSFDIVQTEVDFGSTATRTKSFVIGDANATPTSMIMATQAMDAPTGKSQDENEMDNLLCKAMPSGSSQFLLVVESLSGPVRDKFKINYTIG